MPSLLPDIARADDPNYYLHNFSLVLSWVRGRDGHLFSAEEDGIFEALGALPEGARRLYVRLYGRKGPFFLVDRLSYAEITDLPGAAAALVEAGFARLGDPADPLDEVLRLATVPELRAALTALEIPLPRPPRRDALLAAIAAADRGALEAALAPLGPRLILAHRPLFDRVVYLFFLNGAQGTGTLLAVDLAHVTFPRYALTRSRPPFVDRAHLMAFEAAREEASELARRLDEGDEAGARALAEAALAALPAEAAALPPRAFLARFSPAWVRARTLGRFARALERLKDHAGAAGLYEGLLASGLSPRRRSHWWERLVTDLTHLGRHEDALDACQRALADPSFRDVGRPAMERRRTSLGKKAGQRVPRPASIPDPPVVHHQARILGSGPQQRTLFEGAGGGPIIVERLALERYADEGFDGTWGENALFTTLFGLLLWDALFMDVPDVFQTPFQDAPLDLRTEGFYPARAAAIDARLAEVRRGEAPRLIEAAFTHQGEACRGVAWGAWDAQTLGIIASALGGEALAMILGALARDYGALSRGLPDLCLWRGGRARLVEVKGPRDRLSEEQRAWLARLMAAGVEVEVFQVVEAG